jgi:hypothetical protein
MAASFRSVGFEIDIKLISATSAQKLGAQANSAGSLAVAATIAGAAATVITDASANPLYISIGLAAGGATDTLTAQSAAIQLITP